MRFAMLVVVIVACAPAPEKPRVKSVDKLNAAVWLGDLATIRAELAGGVDPDRMDAANMAPWMWAMITKDRASLELLFGGVRRLDPTRLENALSLRLAAAQDDQWLVGALLDRGLPVDAPADDRSSPLLVASSNGWTDTMRLLVERGANVDLADAGGDTPLMAAVRAGCGPCVELLLGKRVDVAKADHAGRTAVAWAQQTDQPDLVERLVAAGATRPAAAPVAAPPTVRDAVTRSVRIMQRGIDGFFGDHICGACHHHPMVQRVVALASKRGIAFDRAMADRVTAWFAEQDREFATKLLPGLTDEAALVTASMENGGDAAYGTAEFLTAHIESGVRTNDLETQAAAIARMQRADGHWETGPLRGIFEGSKIAVTATASRVLATYAPDPKRLERARRFIVQARPRTTFERAYRLSGLVWTGASPKFVAEAVAELRGLQRTDGSWSYLHGAGPGDVPTTAIALVALHREGGMSVDDPIYRRGVAYLLRTQQSDGSWLVHSRAPPFQPPMETGFPHGKFQIVSFASTGWATLALLDTLEDR
jgi:hypothetical protein